MMLGDILRQAQQAAALLDPALREQIEAQGEAPAAFARAAVTSFERHAAEEDWATMMSAIRSAADPGKACLEMMVRWRLRHACACAASSEEHARDST
jgi:hypothetical protein